jgi:hypothetical protein
METSAIQSGTLVNIDPASLTPEILLGQDELVVRPVANAAELRMVYQLVHDCYVGKGYARPQPDGLLIHYPEFDFLEETTVFVAVWKGEIVGTFSFTLDGSAGMSTDGDFQEECERIRLEKRRLATGWRLAIKKSARSHRHIVMSLIKQTIRAALAADVTSWVISVNPEHENLYRRMLNMYVVGRKETTSGLTNAPAVLMRCDIERLPDHWYALKRQSVIKAGIQEIYRGMVVLSALCRQIESPILASGPVSRFALMCLLNLLIRNQLFSLHFFDPTYL